MQKDNNQINNVIDEIKNVIYKKMKSDIDNFNKQTYNLKIEFQKDLLEKVYLIGSYYWSKKIHLLMNYLEGNGKLYQVDFYSQMIAIILLILLVEKKNIL